MVPPAPPVAGCCPFPSPGFTPRQQDTCPRTSTMPLTSALPQDTPLKDKQKNHWSNAAASGSSHQYDCLHQLPSTER